MIFSPNSIVWLEKILLTQKEPSCYNNLNFSHHIYVETYLSHLKLCKVLCMQFLKLNTLKCSNDDLDQIKACIYGRLAEKQLHMKVHRNFFSIFLVFYSKRRKPNLKPI